MKEYVSLQAVLDIVMQYCPDDDGSCSKADVDPREMLDEIEALPSVDVSHGKCGEWEIGDGNGMNTGCFKCAKAQWDADGCTCEITGLLVGNAKMGCEYRKDPELKPCPFCGSNNVKIHMPYFASDCYIVQCYECNCNTAIYESAENAAEAWNRRIENDKH